MEEVRPDDGKISMFRHRTARSPKECVVRALAHLHRLPYGGNIIFRVTPIWGMSDKTEHAEPWAPRDIPKNLQTFSDSGRHRPQFITLWLMPKTIDFTSISARSYTLA
jgi:hypothetical protein